jgi:hypothetical protein
MGSLCLGDFGGGGPLYFGAVVIGGMLPMALAIGASFKRWGVYDDR